MPRPRLGRGLAAAFALAVALAGPRAAHAYVRYRTATGLPWSWHGTNCLSIVAYPRDFPDMTADAVGAAATAAAAAWSVGESACSFLSLSIALSTDTGPLVIPAARAAVVFRETKWCRILGDGSCGTKPEDVAAYDSAALMLTTATVNPRTGGMVQAGIEVNAVDHAWADLVAHPERTDAVDLQNGLTHELGHFIGLDHNCAPSGELRPPLDDTGNPAPDCLSAPLAITEATMFPDAPPGDVAKRTLADDDRHGLCDSYPVAANPGTCGPADPGPIGSACACDAAPGASGAPLAGLGLAGLLALGRRRGRR
jgi:MYXO-CTERM domain-containing protein